MATSHATACATALALLCGLAHAQQPAPPGMGLAEMAARRFPQPISVAALVGRTVLEPLESQRTLGHVDRVVRTGAGQVDVVVEYGGFLGLGRRPIAVPVEAMVLLGPYMEIIGFKPDQLRTFPTFNAADTTVLPPGEVVHVGLARPSH